MTHKRSMAVPLWIGLLVVVLCLLFFETRTKRQDKFNFFINSDQQAIGAEVFIDNSKVGVISGDGASGLGGGAFWTYVRNGRHLVEVRKPGFGPFKRQIDMRQEDYLGVDLQRLNH